MTLYNGTPTVGIPDDNKYVVATSIDIEVDGNIVGAIDSYSPSHSRPVTRVRELSSVAGGRIIEMAPSPEDVTVSVTGFLLYTAGKHTLFQRLQGSAGTDFVSLQSQRIPFDVVERYIHPATNEEWKKIYKGCWLSNYSKSQNIGTALVAENATIEVQAVK